METSIREARSRAEIELRPELRREAGKALSGRVPVLLSIAVAALSGVLAGYTLRAASEGGGSPEVGKREPLRVRAVCPLRAEWLEPALPPPRLQLLAHRDDGGRAAVAEAAGRAAAKAMAALAGDVEATLCAVVDSLQPLVSGDLCGG